MSGQMKARVTAATVRQIERYCLREGLSEDDFGARCNLSGMTIRRLTAKSNRQTTARMSTARAIARGMGLEVPDLFAKAK
jgi:hypothetical protein